MTEEKKIRIFEFNDVKGEFEELDIDPELPLYNLLDSSSILLFIDPKNKRVWIWIGNNSTTKMKFYAVYLSYSIRDRYAFGYKIVSINEGDESREFKIMIGLEKEEELVEQKVEPIYKETEEFIASVETVIDEDKRQLAKLNSQFDQGQITKEALDKEKQRVKENQKVVADAVAGVQEKLKMFEGAQKEYDSKEYNEEVKKFRQGFLDMKYCLPKEEAIPLAARIFQSAFPYPGFLDRFLSNLQ